LSARNADGAVDAGEAGGGRFLEGMLPDADDAPSAGFPRERSCLLQLARLSTVKM
jgi:hypothetical protein